MFFDKSTISQSNISISNDLFKQYVLQLASDIIWKNQTFANNNEDSKNFYLAELFVLANRGLLNFDIIKSFPRVVLRNCGVAEELVDRYAADKKTIPVNLRDVLINEYIKALTQKNPITGHYEYYDKESDKYVMVYEERNNYYRMLMGLPDIGDNRFIYNSDPRWSTTIPIHQMSMIDRLEMEQEGVLAKLIAENPTVKYLKHVGSKKIDYFKSRIANRFDILYYSPSNSDVLNKTFVDEYLKASYVINNVYYSKAFLKNNNLYENFLAMSVLFMTIQNLFYKYLKTDTTRDFFDVESLKLIYDSYQVPFYSEIPLEYHRRIVKNMNKLLSYKGSSNVFFDLFKIFDLASMDIYSYYLTKIHKMDENGNPIFIIKKDENDNDMIDINGDPILDDSVFDIEFSRVKIYDDPALSTADRSNRVDYDVVTEPDPYWIEDAELQKKLKEEYFNYTESKYLGIQTVFDLMKITFENAYIFRMITDNKSLTEKMEIKWIEANLDINLFSLFIYLAAIYCRYYGYTGIISNKIPAILDTLGYNFEEISPILKDDILSDPVLSKDQKLIDLINSIKLSNIYSTNFSLEQIKLLRDYIITRYTEAEDRETFTLYKALYDSILSSKEVTKTYTNPQTGEVYHSFTDILTDVSPELMQRYLLLPENTISSEMTLIINQLEKLITNLRYLPYSAGVSSSAMIEALFKILKFFKSAKAELVEYRITYMITMRGLNFFKMMDKLHSCYTKTWADGQAEFIDLMDTCHELIELIADYSLTREEYDSLSFKTYVESDIQLYTDILKQLSEYIHYKFRDEVWYIDILNIASNTVKIKSILNIEDSKELELRGFIPHAHRYNGLIKDVYEGFNDELIGGERLVQIYAVLSIYDKVHIITNSITSRRDEYSSNISLSDRILGLLKYEYFEKNEMLDDQLKMLDIFFKVDEDSTMEDRVHKILETIRTKNIMHLSEIISYLNISYKTNDTPILKEVFKLVLETNYIDNENVSLLDKVSKLIITQNSAVEENQQLDILIKGGNIARIGNRGKYFDTLHVYEDGRLTPIN